MKIHIHLTQSLCSSSTRLGAHMSAAHPSLWAQALDYLNPDHNPFDCLALTKLEFFILSLRLKEI